MLIEEITRSCSHEQVALAAVASLGRGFSRRVSATAHAYGLSAGAFAALTVQRFDHSASESERNAVRRVMRGSDYPILTGLRCIIEPALELNVDRHKTVHVEVEREHAIG